MMNKTLKRINCVIVAIVMALGINLAPLTVVAFDENGTKVTIDPITVEIKNAWRQIQNAAAIQLVTQKLYQCINSNRALVGTVRPSQSGWRLLTDPIGYWHGAVETGLIFSSGEYDLENDTDIGVGPYLGTLIIGQDGLDGDVECDWQNDNNSNLFNMFVYLTKNYQAGFKIGDLSNPAVSIEDRLKLICNGTEPGLLAPAEYVPFVGLSRLDNIDCSDYRNIDLYTGQPSSDQLAIIKRHYDDFKGKADNKYLVDWSNLDYYEKETGYYLYSLDFSVQCGGATFSTTKGEDTNAYDYVKGYKVDDDSGKVTDGYYKLSKNDDARQSFVKSSLTCHQLVENMNKYIKPYITFVNFEIFKACREGINVAIDKQREVIDKKYLQKENVKEEVKADAQLVLEEYQRIQDMEEYTARIEDDGSETLYRTKGEGSIDEFPTEFIWTCRSHLPFIDAVVQEEDRVVDALGDEFYDACYDAVDLAWVVCPIINGVSNTVDELRSAVEGFF